MAILVKYEPSELTEGAVWEKNKNIYRGKNPSVITMFLVHYSLRPKNFSVDIFFPLG